MSLANTPGRDGEARRGAPKGRAGVMAIEDHRPALLAEARRTMGRAVRAKEGASDVVQEAMMVAVQRFDHFEGRSPEDLLAWLRRILEHQIAHAVRKFRGTEKRSVDREVPIHTEPDRLRALAIDSPSPGTKAVHRDEERALREAIGRLDDQDARLVLWRHIEECSFEELGRRLGCSNVAARNRWLRAIRRLRGELAGEGLEG
ncbi:sigma-70 family RNA polymerase sigma factor [Tautonia sp. JC769]|uniref:sigma-70 family RNA polymerase sigma factor n=1 Tax=Tautonia sp. JC769 TaxID=3232135 RepID=UPI00345860C4